MAQYFLVSSPPSYFSSSTLVGLRRLPKDIAVQGCLLGTVRHNRPPPPRKEPRPVGDGCCSLPTPMAPTCFDWGGGGMAALSVSGRRDQRRQRPGSGSLAPTPSPQAAVPSPLRACFHLLVPISSPAFLGWGTVAGGSHWPPVGGGVLYMGVSDTWKNTVAHGQECEQQLIN